MSEPEKKDGVQDEAQRAEASVTQPEEGSWPERTRAEKDGGMQTAGDDAEEGCQAEGVEAPEVARPGGEGTGAEEVRAQEQKPPARGRDEVEGTSRDDERQGVRPADPEDADDVLTHRAEGTEAEDAAVLAESRRRTRRSFVVAAGAAAAGFGFYRYLDRGPQNEDQPGLVRDALLTNAAIARGLFRGAPLAPTYPLSRAENLRTNGVFGLKMPLRLESWRLQVVGSANAATDPRFSPDVTAYEYAYTEGEQHEDQGHDTKVDPKLATARKMAPEPMGDKAEEDENHTGRKPRGMEESGESDSTLPPGTPGLLLQMEDVLRLPRHELVTQFKCIEGWSQIVHWAGVRMRDFLERYPPATVDGKEPRYVYLETPNGDYYCGYDLSAMRHPQTLLVTEMMGEPLTQFHGAPLRLHMPTKYGYKQLKRIGLIAYMTEKPDDYWTKLGYDWDAGL